VSEIKPKFGDHVVNHVASVGNPHREGVFVCVVRREGKVNRGTWWRCSDTNGNFWETNPSNCSVVRNYHADEVERLEAERDEQKASKDTAYSERDMLVCLISKLFPSHLERHPSSDESWEDDWRWIVFVELPTGQATWHIHDSELSWFDHLQRTDGNTWDGHTTSEKYCRVERIERISSMAQNIASCDANNRLEALAGKLAEALKVLYGWVQAESEHFDANSPDDFIKVDVDTAITAWEERETVKQEREQNG